MAWQSVQNKQTDTLATRCIIRLHSYSTGITNNFCNGNLFSKIVKYPRNGSKTGQRRRRRGMAKWDTDFARSCRWTVSGENLKRI